MARKPLKAEDINPSYDEIIGELNNIISKLIMENTIMKVTNKKMEAILEQIHQESQQVEKEF